MKRLHLMTAALTAALLGLLLTGCGASEEAKSDKTDSAAVYVDGVPVPETLVAPRMSTGNVMFSTLSEEEKEQKKAELRAAALETLVAEQAYLNDAEKNGIRLEGDLLAAADTQYNNMIASVEAYVKQSYPDLAGKELDETVDSMITVSGATREVYRLMAERAVLLSAYDEFLLKGMPQPTEAEISARYETLYAEQKALFDSDENAFEAAMLNGKIVVYRPVPLKMIQKAEFFFEDTAIGIIRSTRMYNTELADEMTEDQYALLDQRFAPVYEALENGEKTFEEVLAMTDPGPANLCNYFHESSTRFSEDYYTRAAAFRTPGEISSYYRITNGYAVLHYLGELPAEERIPQQSVEEAISAEILSARKEAFLSEKKAEVLSRAVITYPEGKK